MQIGDLGRGTYFAVANGGGLHKKRRFALLGGTR
jgi:hypothetical protein